MCCAPLSTLAGGWRVVLHFDRISSGHKMDSRIDWLYELARAATAIEAAKRAMERAQEIQQQAGHAIAVSRELCRSWHTAVTVPHAALAVCPDRGVRGGLANVEPNGKGRDLIGDLSSMDLGHRSISPTMWASPPGRNRLGLLDPGPPPRRPAPAQTRRYHSPGGGAGTL